MRRLLAFGLCFTAGLGITRAADLDITRSAPHEIPSSQHLFDSKWSGLYVGASVGGAWGRSKWSNTDTFDLSGAIGGGIIGYGFRADQIAFGIESDIIWSGISGSTINGCSVRCETSNSWLATVRGRLGYSWDRFLPFVTAGVALGDVKATQPSFAGASSLEMGWVAGLGFEYALTPNWNLRAEFLHIDLGAMNCATSCAATPVSTELKEDLIKVGFTYYFAPEPRMMSVELGPRKPCDPDDPGPLCRVMTAKKPQKKQSERQILSASAPASLTSIGR